MLPLLLVAALAAAIAGPDGDSRHEEQQEPVMAACKPQVDVRHRAVVDMVGTSAGCFPTGQVRQLQEGACSAIFDGEGSRLYYDGEYGPVFVTSCLVRLPETDRGRV